MNIISDIEVKKLFNIDILENYSKYYQIDKNLVIIRNNDQPLIFTKNKVFVNRHDVSADIKDQVHKIWFINNWWNFAASNLEGFFKNIHSYDHDLFFHYHDSIEESFLFFEEIIYKNKDDKFFISELKEANKIYLKYQDYYKIYFNLETEIFNLVELL